MIALLREGGGGCPLGCVWMVCWPGRYSNARNGYSSKIQRRAVDEDSLRMGYFRGTYVCRLSCAPCSRKRHRTHQRLVMLIRHTLSTLTLTLTLTQAPSLPRSVSHSIVARTLSPLPSPLSSPSCPSPPPPERGNRREPLRADQGAYQHNCPHRPTHSFLVVHVRYLTYLPCLTN